VLAALSEIIDAVEHLTEDEAQAVAAVLLDVAKKGVRVGAAEVSAQLIERDVDVKLLLNVDDQ
jgi:hypothetical protein